MVLRPDPTAYAMKEALCESVLVDSFFYVSRFYLSLPMNTRPGIVSWQISGCGYLIIDRCGLVGACQYWTRHTALQPHCAEISLFVRGVQRITYQLRNFPVSF